MRSHDMPRGAAEHHQHYDVGQSVAYVPLVRPAEIGDERGEFYPFFQNAAMEFGLVLSLRGQVERMCAGRTYMENQKLAHSREVTRQQSVRHRRIMRCAEKLHTSQL